MGQRHQLYYYVVHELLIKRKDRQDIIDQIREGKVQLVYDLTEFAGLDLEDCESSVQDTVLVHMYYYHPFNICLHTILHIMELIVLHILFRLIILLILLVLR